MSASTLFVVDRFDLEDPVERSVGELFDALGRDDGAHKHGPFAADAELFARVGSLSENDLAGVVAIRGTERVAAADLAEERTLSEQARGGCLLSRLHREPFRPIHDEDDAVAMSTRTHPAATGIRKTSVFGRLA